MANIRHHHPEAILEVTSITITTWTSLKQLNTSSGWILGPEHHEMSVNINQKNDLWLNITKMFSSKFSKSRKSRCCTMLRARLRAGIIRSQTPLGLRWNVHHFRRPQKNTGEIWEPKIAALVKCVEELPVKNLWLIGHQFWWILQWNMFGQNSKFQLAKIKLDLQLVGSEVDPSASQPVFFRDLHGSKVLQCHLSSW